MRQTGKPSIFGKAALGAAFAIIVGSRVLAQQGVAAPTGADQGALPPPVVAVVDVDQIMQDSLAARAVREQAAKFRQEFQQQAAGEEAALRATQQTIEQERKTLSQQALADRVHALDLAVADYQRKELARRRAYEKSFNVAMAKVQGAMNDALGQYSKEHNINLVLPRGQVLIFSNRLGITKEIIMMMDKSLPGVDFPVPQLELEPTVTPPSAAPPKKKN